ncbi:MAG: 2Fe-2S iron-sulfur cluster-binding protein [Campylobacterota bacterium]|nr:2Fe-2S iron-sulfur cluster-binding protein [Campylobacterota bacterium]
MRIEVLRTTNERGFKEQLIEYEIDADGLTLLQALQLIKEKNDNSLSFSSGCESSICGSCAMRVNDKEVLACAYKVQDGDVVTPLKYMVVKRDLIVDSYSKFEQNSIAKAYSTLDESKSVTKDEAKINELQSDCILCTSCYSACPVYELNSDFIGPFALTRAWRYVSDTREKQSLDIITAVQNSGIWDCTLCGECYIACPQGISPKSDIEKLRAKSGILGFLDPNFSTGFGGGLDFGAPQF